MTYLETTPSAHPDYQQEKKDRIARFGSDAEFRALSNQWRAMALERKYMNNFSWLGRPLIQLPMDAMALQEIIWTVKPELVIETGVAHGGSLVLSASMLEMIGHGSVVGVDIEIRPHNRKAIEAHELAGTIRLVEGNSVAADTVAKAAAEIRPGDTVLVVLDSNHTREHVAAELEAYHHLVTPGSYIVATDGIMRDVHDVPRGTPGWKTDNPAQAAEDFAARHREFVLETPRWRFNESDLDKSITAWPSAWLKKRA
jgi:cephalosporin hydroxylase